MVMFEISIKYATGPTLDIHAVELCCKVDRGFTLNEFVAGLLYLLL